MATRKLFKYAPNSVSSRTELNRVVWVLTSHEEGMTLLFPLNFNNYTTVYMYVEIFARRKFSPILPPAVIGENFITLFFCPVLKSA